MEKYIGMTKQAAISAMLLDAIAKHGSVKLGFDEVFGEGAHEKLAGELYDALRAKAVTK